MSGPTIPPAPEEVPDDLCAEILNLDEATLGKLQEWICTSVPSKQEPLTEEVTNIPKESMNGTEVLANLSTEEKRRSTFLRCWARSRGSFSDVVMSNVGVRADDPRMHTAHIFNDIM